MYSSLFVWCENTALPKPVSKSFKPCAFLKYCSYLVVSMFLVYCKKGSVLENFSSTKLKISEHYAEIDKMYSEAPTQDQIMAALYLMCGKNQDLYNECIRYGEELLREGVVLSEDSEITRYQLRNLVAELTNKDNIIVGKYRISLSAIHDQISGLSGNLFRNLNERQHEQFSKSGRFR